MESLALLLSFLALIVQFSGVLSENYSIGNEINKIYRFKRSHEHDKALSSTKNKDQGMTNTEKSKIDVSNENREQIPQKGKLKIGKDGPKEGENKIISIKQSEKLVNLRNLHHFIEDVDEELPVPVKHIQMNEYRLQEAFKAALQNKTSNDTKPLQKNKIENIPKKLLPENTTKESPHESIPKLKTSDPEHDEKPTVKSLLNVNGQFRAQLVNTTKGAVEKSNASVCKSPKNEMDIKKPGPENSVIEIKEHKYEEEIVRYYPSKSCQPNIKRHWEASQNFNPQFGNNPYNQAMNPNGLTQADPYQRVTYNKDNYLAAYTCANVKDGSSGDYFYANFDVKPYNQAKERRYQGYGNYDRIRKVWLDRDTKIRTAKPDEYVATNVKDVKQ